MDITKAGRFLGRTRNHLYFLPDKGLMPYIAHYTLTMPSKISLPASKNLTLIPDASGCIVVSFEQTGYFWGPTTKIHTVENDLEQAPWRLFVEFMPAGAYCFTQRPQSDFLDCRIALESFDKVLAIRLQELVSSSDCLDTLRIGLDKIFYSYLYSNKNIDSRKLLKEIEGKSVREAASYTAYSQRQLNRLFHETVGMGMKSYQNLQRLNRFLNIMRQSSASFTQLAQEAGYYDQSHFIREFKKFVGMTPGQYQKNLSAFYNEIYKF